ncbi:MAG: hypothetical protein M1815_004203 [Lichina confinis]|nr:MAG: hypothetical protein M1815_004203 [Lichina confinis]
MAILNVVTPRHPRSSIAKLLPSKISMGKTHRNAPTDSGRGGRGGRGGGGGGGGGGRRGGRADGPPSREVTISKAMSYVLRHAADREGLRLDGNGYARASDLLQWHKLKRLSVEFDELKEIVRRNEKQRFALVRDPALTLAPDHTAFAAANVPDQEHIPKSTQGNRSCDDDDDDDDDPSNYLIRATQGHSIAIDHKNLLTPLTLETAPAVALHGTYSKSWPLILKSGGLRRMTRTLIHFAPAVLPGFDPVAAPSSLLSTSSSQAPPSSVDAPQGLEAPAQPDPTISADPDPNPDPAPDLHADPDPAPDTNAQTSEAQKSSAEPQVISGMRTSADVLIYVDVHRSMREANVQWWRSDNGVLLTDGEDGMGLLSTGFFVKAIHKGKRTVLWEHGKAA